MRNELLKSYTIKELVEDTYNIINTYENELTVIHDLYQVHQSSDNLYLMNINDIDILSVLPRLKDIDLDSIVYHLKEKLSYLFFESGFRSDALDCDLESFDLITNMDVNISPHEILSVTFYMAIDEPKIIIQYILEGRFLHMSALLKEKLMSDNTGLDYQIMSIYQKELNQLYNISSNPSIAKKCYQTLNRLIKKERPLKPIGRLYSSNHSIICPTCKQKLTHQHQYYCMYCGQKLMLNSNN